MGEPGNLLDLYRLLAGKTECPPEYHLWSCLSLLAATVSNRVWVKGEIEGRPIYPNLFVFLIGESTVGKGEAIGLAESLGCRIPGLRWYNGSLSREALIDLIRDRVRRDSPPDTNYSKLWILCPEFIDAILPGPAGYAFLQFLTKVWEGTLNTGHRTRSGGSQMITNPCLNVLAGTTKTWLKKSLTADFITGGFFGRSIPIYYDGFPTERRAEYAPGRDDYFRAMLAHLHRLSTVSGELPLTVSARGVLEEWWQDRHHHQPKDARLIPSYRRERATVYKLAMLAALAQPRAKLEITERHVEVAIELITEVRPHIKAVVEYAATTEETEGIQLLREMLRSLPAPKAIPRSVLVKKSEWAGLAGDRYERAIRHLVSTGEISVEGVGRKPFVVWLGKRRRVGVDSEVTAPTNHDGGPGDDQSDPAADDP